jgi:branched-chain amino acid aminotransferase
MGFVPFDERPGLMWRDGKLVEAKTATVHPYCNSLQYASCVIEGERPYSGHVFKQQAHTDRLLYSAEMLDYEVPYTADQLNAAVEAVVKANELILTQKRELYVRRYIYRGSEDLRVAGLKCSVHVEIGIVEVASPLLNDQSRLKGVRLEVGFWKRPPPSTTPFDTKTAVQFTNSTLGTRAAKKHGFDDALQLDWEGYLADSTISNVFLVYRDPVSGEYEIHTPLANCFLPGITRETIIELALLRDMKVVIRKIKPEEIVNAKEVFLCGTAIEVVPVCEIAKLPGQTDRLTFPVGETTKAFMSEYEALVHKPPHDVEEILSAVADKRDQVYAEEIELKRIYMMERSEYFQ